MLKKTIGELAVFEGKPLFDEYMSTSNLLRPDIEKFLNYSKDFYEVKQYTNNGPNVQLLEKRLAQFHQTKYCLTFSSGFWALALAAKVLAIKGRSEIIMPSLTYRRMTDMSAWVNLAPHFCEVDEKTLAMTAETVDSCINENTALILAVHPIVNCCESAKLVSLAELHGIPILFDSVESVFESSAEGKTGQFGEAECFSLHACKLFNGFGGGYLTTNNEILAKQLSAMRSFGFVGKDEVGFENGLNSKLNEMHACMALASLDDINQQIAENKLRYQAYRKGLSTVPGIELLEFDERFASGYKNIVAKVDENWPFTRDETVTLLNAEKVLARPHYDPPLHLKEMNYPHIKSRLPITERLAKQYINLPCGQKVTVDNIEKIVSLLVFLRHNAASIKRNMLK